MPLIPSCADVEPEQVLQLDPLLSADLAAAAHGLAAGHRAKTSIDNHDVLVGAEVALRRTSPELVSALVSFRLNSSRDGIMLLRGLAIDEPLPPTPYAGTFPGSWRDLPLSTATQLMVMSVLGDVISYAEEKDGRLIQDVCPVRGAETRQENTGSSLLELHTEDGFHPNKPHFLSLLALRADHARLATTVAGGIRAVLHKLDSEHVEVLGRPWFRIRMASSFVGTERTVYSLPMAVLSGAPDDPDLCVDFHAMEALNEPAEAALEAFSRQMLESLVGTVLEPGDMLLVDNRKAVHGRTGFTPRYDGEDRWLRRCFAVADLRASHALRYPGSRMHRPLRDAEVAAR